MDPNLRNQNNVARMLNDQLNGQSQTTAPVSSGLNKEMEAHGVAEYIAPSETAPVLDKEVKEVGVEAVSEKPNLTTEHEDIGVKHSLENNDINTQAENQVKLPVSEQQLDSFGKIRDTSSSGFWLWQLVHKIKKTVFWR